MAGGLGMCTGTLYEMGRHLGLFAFFAMVRQLYKILNYAPKADYGDGGALGSGDRQ